MNGQGHRHAVGGSPVVRSAIKPVTNPDGGATRIEHVTDEKFGRRNR